MPKSMMSEKVKSFATGNREGILSLSEETRRRILSENPGLVPELKEYLKDGAISANSLVYMPDRKVEGAVILQRRAVIRCASAICTSARNVRTKPSC